MKKVFSYSGMSKVVESIKGQLKVEIDAFNKNIYLLPIQNNKVINLSTLEIRDRAKEDYFNFECPVSYIQNCNNYENINDFMDKISCYNVELKEYMRDINAYFLTGLMTDRSFYVETGIGRNGKSTMNEIREEMMGSFYKSLDQAVVVKRPNNSAGSATTHLIPLLKSRLGVVCEVAEDEVLNDVLIKSITGGDKVPMRDVYKSGDDETKRKIQTKLVIQSNNIPEVKKYQRAVLDRFKVIPYNARFERECDYIEGKKNTFKADSVVAKKLSTEYLNECFKSVVSDMNPLEEFFENYYTITNENEDYVVKSEFIEHLKGYTKANEIRTLNNKDIKNELSSRGIDNAQRKMIDGIRIEE
eukprot:Pgem_evm4s8721